MLRQKTPYEGICEDCGGQGWVQVWGYSLVCLCDADLEKREQQIRETAKLYKELRPKDIPIEEVSSNRLRDDEQRQGLGPEPFKRSSTVGVV